MSKEIAPFKHSGTLSILLLLPFPTSMTTRAQGPARPTPSDVVRESNRRELDSLLLRKPIRAAEDRAVRQALLKQINDDFRDLQVLNNKMMADATTTQDLDYKYISNMISQIGSKATRLKSNLVLPRSNTRATPQTREISNAEELRSALLAFDKVVVSFTLNPLFQKAGVVELDLANKASQDLAAIIELSGRLKKAAAKLGKGQKSVK